MKEQTKIEVNDMKRVRVRAAPSPTGRVHVGTLRTMLYDFLLARKYGGANILRIEDTDQKRKVEKGAEGIIEVTQLFGIVYDEGPHKGGEYGPYVQTERRELYQKYAKELVEKDKAYYCFCSKERLEEVREKQKAAKQPTMYDGLCRDLDPAKAAERVAAGESHVVRLKVPRDGFSEYVDQVFGRVKFQNRLVDDTVLMKSDGLPTYHMAVVVDDHLMQISHIIRATEWIPSTPKQILLYNAFGWEMPKFVHVPPIQNPEDRKKLSKRKGAWPAVSYLRMGYLRDAVLNYIAMVGWSPAPDRANPEEIYSLEELIELFDLARIQKQGGHFDMKKMNAINGKHIRRLSLDQLHENVIRWAEQYVLAELITDGIDEMPDWQAELRAKVAAALPLWKSDEILFKKALALVHERLVYLGELPDLLTFFYADTLSWSDEVWHTKNHDKAQLADGLELLLPKLENVFAAPEVTHEMWEMAVRSTADQLGWKHGDLFMAVRSATTGSMQSPPLFESFEVMGYKKALKFIREAIVWLKS